MQNLRIAALLTAFVCSNAAGQISPPIHVTSCVMSNGSATTSAGSSFDYVAARAPSGSVIVFDLDCSGVELRAAIVVEARDLTIDANGHQVTILRCPLSCAPPGRLFEIGAGGRLKLSGVTMKNSSGMNDRTRGPDGTQGRSPFGRTPSNPDGTVGGAIYVRRGGVLIVDRCTITRSSAAEGGGVFNDGTATISNTEMTGNTGGLGGAISNAGLLTIVGSTISDNLGQSDAGGGIFNYGTAKLVNSTVAGNHADLGGGIYNVGTFSVQSSTISDNTLAISIDLVGTRYVRGVMTEKNGKFSIANSIVADCEGVIVDEGHNSGGGTCGFVKDAAFGDTKLGPLRNNGGPTRTMALSMGSAAIGTGWSSLCSDLGATDQRGQGRRVPCDIGAYDTGGKLLVAILGITVNPTNAIRAGANAMATITIDRPAGIRGLPIPVLALGRTSSVTVPEGQTSTTVLIDARYNLDTSDDSIVATIGSVRTKAPLYIDGGQILSVAATPSSAVAGSSVELVVTITKPAIRATTVYLKSSNPVALDAPSSIKVTAGQTVGRVMLRSNPRVSMDSDSAVITAEVGRTAGTATVRVDKPLTVVSRERIISAPPPVDVPDVPTTAGFSIKLPTGLMRGEHATFVCMVEEGTTRIEILFGGESGLLGAIVGKTAQARPGTHAVAEDEDRGWTIGISKLTPPLATYPASAGTITILEWTKTRVRGSFRYSGKMDDVEGVSRNHVVSGSFSATATIGC